MFKLLNFTSLKSKKSTTLIFGNIILTLLNFLIVIVLSNKLSINFYGQIREIMLYAGFVYILGSAGFSQTSYYFLNKTDDELEVLKITGALRFILFLFTTIVFFGLFIFNLFNPISLGSTEKLVLVIYLVALILSSVDLNLSYYHKKGKGFFMANGIIILIKLILVFQFTKYEFSLLNFLFILSLTQWLTVFYSVLSLKKRYFGSFGFGDDFSIIKKLFRYALPITVSTILGFLILNTDKILISFVNLSKDKLAIISNISFEAPIVSTIYFSFFTIALPSMIKAFEKKDYKQVLAERFNYTYTVAKLILPIVVSFIVWNQDYIAVIFGAVYRDYGFLFAVFSTISLLRFCSHHDIFLATNNTSYILYYQIIEFVFQVILSIILYYIYDLLGLVIASVVTNYCYMFFVNLKSSKILKVRFIDVLPFKFLIKRLVILSSSAFFIKILFENLYNDIFWIIPLVIWLIIVAIVEFRTLKTQNG
jgi:O-antigen/teichoic acid export membrane protein